MNTNFDSIWEKLAQELAERIASIVMSILKPFFDRFFKAAVQLTLTEKEAANMLHVSIYTMQNYRKQGRIDFYQYNGKEVNYSLAHLQDFLARSEHRKNGKPRFTMSREISVFGIETISAPQNKE